MADYKTWALKVRRKHPEAPTYRFLLQTDDEHGAAAVNTMYRALVDFLLTLHPVDVLVELPNGILLENPEWFKLGYLRPNPQEIFGNVTYQDEDTIRCLFSEPAGPEERDPRDLLGGGPVSDDDDPELVKL